MSTAAEIERWRRNLQDEVDSAELYRIVASAEEDAALASVYRRLAEAEERHAGFWAGRLRDAGQPVATPRVGWRTRMLGWLARRFGTAFVVPTIDALEQQDASSYDAQPEAVGSELPAEERSHARLLRAIGSGQPGGRLLRRPTGADRPGCRSAHLRRWPSDRRSGGMRRRCGATRRELSVR